MFWFWGLGWGIGVLTLFGPEESPYKHSTYTGLILFEETEKYFVLIIRGIHFKEYLKLILENRHQWQFLWIFFFSHLHSFIGWSHPSSFFLLRSSLRELAIWTLFTETEKYGSHNQRNKCLRIVQIHVIIFPPLPSFTGGPTLAVSIYSGAARERRPDGFPMPHKLPATRLLFSPGPTILSLAGHISSFLFVNIFWTRFEIKRLELPVLTSGRGLKWAKLKTTTKKV